MGSGSACRSLYGGWVQWEMGSLQDGSDSRAVQVASETHWPEMRVIVLVVNDQKKDTSSADGMQESVRTSKLMKIRAEQFVPKRMKEMQQAILNKDYQTFGDLTMKDSDDFHDVCADTVPAIHYLKPISKNIIKLIHGYNQHCGRIEAAYTYDAGPNAVLYLLERNVVPILALVSHYFPPMKTSEASFCKDTTLWKQAQKYQIPNGLKSLIEVSPDALKYILYTTIGQGPQILSPQYSLLDHSSGLPYSKL